MLNVGGGVNRGPAVHQISGIHPGAGFTAEQSDFGFVTGDIGAFLQAESIILRPGLLLHRMERNMIGFKGLVLIFVMINDGVSGNKNFIDLVQQIARFDFAGVVIIFNQIDFGTGTDNYDVTDIFKQVAPFRTGKIS